MYGVLRSTLVDRPWHDLRDEQTVPNKVIVSNPHIVQSEYTYNYSSTLVYHSSIEVYVIAGYLFLPCPTPLHVATQHQSMAFGDWHHTEY